ncbi:MAG: DUF3786 domain-containing protein [Desulfobaccales bacterium]
MLYEKCSEVSSTFWEELKRADLAEICRRTGAQLRQGILHLPFFNRALDLDLRHHRVWVPGAAEAEPDFLTCMTALLYLLKIDPARLGPAVSPMELTGATTFFQTRGPHALPSAPLEQRFGSDLTAFLEAGRRLGAEARGSGDAALALKVFPGLTVEVVLWKADEEFPSQASFTVPAHLDRYWQLDAVLGLLQLVVAELLAAAP